MPGSERERQRKRGKREKERDVGMVKVLNLKTKTKELELSESVRQKRKGEERKRDLDSSSSSLQPLARKRRKAWREKKASTVSQWAKRAGWMDVEGGDENWRKWQEPAKPSQAKPERDEARAAVCV